ncbi:MAG: hypothetical protein IJJ84_14640 [Kiritimatiellae bacterium]|nr:hypothetical protein [Kiritimatiellia bacterium]
MVNRRDFIGLGAGTAASGLIPRCLAQGMDYQAPQLARVAKRVTELSRKTDAGFFFITDLHVADNFKKSGELLAELVRRTPIRRTICGGDIGVAFSWKSPSDEAAVKYAASEFRAKWVKPIEAAGGDIYTAKGNHDFSTGKNVGATEGCTLTCRETRDILMDSRGCRAAVVNPDEPDSCYYYFDDSSARFRYVVADTTDSVRGDPPKRSIVYGMHDSQLAWMAEKALGTVPDGWSVVVVHHVPIVGVLADEGVEKFYAPFRQMIEAYQNRGRTRIGGREIDFSGARGRIVLDLTGHMHGERQTWKNGILHVTEPCDAAYGDYIPGSAPWCGALPKKVGGTPFEQTFDAVQIDIGKGLVYFTRVGGGQDRVVHFMPRTVRVGDSLRLVAENMPEVDRWACYDGDRVTFRSHPENRWNKLIDYHSDCARIDGDGVLTALKPGVTMVLAIAQDWRKEIMPVRIIGKNGT